MSNDYNNFTTKMYTYFIEKKVLKFSRKLFKKKLKRPVQKTTDYFFRQYKNPTQNLLTSVFTREINRE